jgi:hypothetical protein
VARLKKNLINMDFSSKIKNYLSEYKTEMYPNIGNGIYKKNKKTYTHIFPEANQFCNLLPTYKDDLVNYLVSEHVELHTDFHHLNSSQAMCFNFFFPFYIQQNLELITDFLGLKNEVINYNSVCFEKKGLEAELGSRKPTSFDFYFETTSGKKIYFEIKYTENGFGKDTQTDIEKRERKFDNYYSNSLKSLNSFYHNQQSFSENYQILRNLIHIDENSFVVFIYPYGNYGIRSAAERVKSDFLISDYHKHFFSVCWESLFEYISTSASHEKIKNQLEDFKEKYLE